MTDNNSSCQIVKTGDCCCQCSYRLIGIDYNSFPEIQQIAWVCVVFATMDNKDTAYIGDFEHGLCELFTRREGIK